MNEKNVDPENNTARLIQEATNQSTPDKALAEQTRRPIPRRKLPPRRVKAPGA
jgi:hypothetical protein